MSINPNKCGVHTGIEQPDNNYYYKSKMFHYFGVMEEIIEDDGSTGAIPIDSNIKVSRWG